MPSNSPAFTKKIIFSIKIIKIIYKDYINTRSSGNTFSARNQSMNFSIKDYLNARTDFMKDFAQKVIQHSQPSREDFDKERKRRNRICTGIVVLYSIVFLGLTCILIEVGLFLSGKFLSFFV